MATATEASAWRRGDDAAVDKDCPTATDDDIWRLLHRLVVVWVPRLRGGDGTMGGGGRSACMVTSTSSIAAVRHVAGSIHSVRVFA